MAKKIQTPAWDRASALERYEATKAVEAKYGKPDMKISNSPKVQGESMNGSKVSKSLTSGEEMVASAQKNEKTRGKGGGYFGSK